MSDKINSLRLCVCMALADHGLGKDETSEILKIAKIKLILMFIMRLMK